MEDNIQALPDLSAPTSEMPIDDDRSLLTVERRMRIVEALKTRKTATVAEMMEWLGASQATIRRDLIWLNEQGLITRTRGGALAISQVQNIPRRTSPSHEQRFNEYVQEKRAIGQCAAEYIADGDAIIIDSGSTSHYLLPYLAKKRDIIIITNSFDVGSELVTLAATNSSLTVVFTGGTLDIRARSFIGMTAEHALTQFFVDKAFLGVRGISLKHGFTNPVIEEIPVKRQMLKSAQQVIVLADHTKFDRTFAGLIAPINAAHVIITDEYAPVDLIEQIRNVGPQVIVAPGLSE